MSQNIEEMNKKLQVKGVKEYFSIYVLEISIEYQVESDVIFLKERNRAPEGIFPHSIRCFDIKKH